MRSLCRLALAACLAVAAGSLSAAEPHLNFDETGLTKLVGADAARQLLVTAGDSAGTLRDVTRRAKFTLSPASLAEIDAAGLLRPKADGIVNIVAECDGMRAETRVEIAGMKSEQPVNFPDRIVPIFTKLGCNSGGCHGKSGGQNGFALSLLGFYPENDYEALVKEGRGRRVFPASPVHSLLLTKIVGGVPHGGGKRLETDSDEYRLLVRWIGQGLPYGSATDPVVTGIECVPNARILTRGGEQQTAVIASYSDGSRQDVTRAALYEANDNELAEVAPSGLVRIRDRAGEVAVMARYQGHVAVFRATVPLGAPITAWPPRRNAVDDAVFDKLKTLGIPPAGLCDDATFLRRATLDLTGALPTETQVRAFLADPAPDKCDRLIDTLLASPGYADCFTNKWNALLRNRVGRILNGQRVDADLPGSYAFRRWIRDSLAQNKPYDRFVTELLTAAGDRTDNPAVVWYREVDEIQEQTEDVAQLFLGTRLQCARCHHHPFEKWSEDDYFRLSAFFSRLGKKPGAGAVVAKKNDASQSRDLRIFHQPGRAVATHPRAKQPLVPAGLGATPVEISPDRDPRGELAVWLTARENPLFAKTLANRYWKHFFGRGIVEPEDDFRATNPPSNPVLLAVLEQHFTASGYDMKALIRLICTSSTYRLSSLPNEHNALDKQNFSRFYPRRIPAEALFDGFQQATGVYEPFAGLPTSTRAIQLPDAAQANYFLQVFGRPQGDTVCECERISDASLAQSLHFVNGEEVQRRLTAPRGRAALWAADTKRPPADKVAEMYRWTLAREPSAAESAIAVEFLTTPDTNTKTAYEDLLWALLTSNEFLFTH